MTGWLARLRPWLAVVLAGLFGAWLGLNVAGTTHTDVGPLSVNAEISPALTGETVVQVAPLGTLVFDTHAAPLRVTLDIRSLDVGAVQQIVENPAAISALQGQLVGDLDDAVATLPGELDERPELRRVARHREHHQHRAGRRL